MSSEYWDCCARLAELWWVRHGAAGAAGVASQRLRALVAHAREHSPFYRSLYRNLPAGELALERLPRVDRAGLMARFDDWCTDREVSLAGVRRFLRGRGVGQAYLGRYHPWKSSGTSGVPGIYLQDGHALAVYDALVAAQFHALPWTVERFERSVAGGARAALVAATGDHFAAAASWEHLRRAYPGAAARAFSVMTPVAELVEQLNGYRPGILAAYPSVLAILAAERRAGRLRIEPALAWSGGETLAPVTRRAIEAAFDCPVIDEYGASECLSIAHGCAHGALHVNAEWVLLEGVEADGAPTPPGRLSHTVLLTNLANWLQPVIRYDLGDRIMRLEGPCPCASRLPAIHVEGRKDDMVAFRSPLGRRVRLPPLALTTVVEECAQLHRFQLVQEGAASLALRIGPGEERAAGWKRAAPALRAYLERQGLPNVRVTLAPEAPRRDPRSGKTRAVVVEARSGR